MKPSRPLLPPSRPTRAAMAGQNRTNPDVFIAAIASPYIYGDDGRDDDDGCDTHYHHTYPPVDNYPGRDNQEPTS